MTSQSGILNALQLLIFQVSKEGQSLENIDRRVEEKQVRHLNLMMSAWKTGV